MPERFLEVRRPDGFVLSKVSTNYDDVPVVHYEELSPAAVGGPMQTWVVELAPGYLLPPLEQPSQVVAGAPRIELFTDRAGEARFRIVASSGEVVPASEGYKGRWGKRNARKTAERFGLPIVEA